ncbi:LuxR C-terminal-related transcriptional regulator [Pseudodesulfovibrio sp.]|uniref:LuxR C-terminal-related transcriptional regulator n=1 Tax=unclassified Pseudodesulfovibrio TaxID=2661612 RepID=UPI003AFFB6AD
MSEAALQLDISSLYHSPRLRDGVAVIHSTPITFIHAPMGYGKTVAVREYLRDKNVSPIWTFVLTQDGNAFWQDFCRVLRGSLPDMAKVADSLEDLGFPGDPARLDAARGMFARLSFPPETVLVFDDVHILASPAADRLFELCLLLVRQGGLFPPIVLISRHAPGKIFAVSMLKGMAAEIGPAFFALTAEEIRSYYACCGVVLDDAEAVRLHTLTGGWISALYLSLLHYTRHGSLSSSVEPHTLLADQIFDPLPAKTRTLLTRLAPLERFPVTLAKLFSDDAEAVFLELLRRNAFIQYDPATACYAFHALFRTFLRKRFDELSAEDRQDVYLRSAEWMIRHGEIGGAVKMLGNVDDCARMLELLNRIADRMLVTEGRDLRLALFRACPPDLLEQYPGVMFRYAMAALSGKDAATFTELLGRLRNYCASLPDDNAEANSWRGELELLSAFTRYNDILGMSECHTRAAEYFRKANTPQSRFFGKDPWTLGSPSVLYMFHRKSGALAEELQQMQDCLPLYQRLTGMHGAGAEDLMLGEVRYNAGEIDAASIAAFRALATAQGNDQTGIEVSALFLLARLDIWNGDFDKALTRIETMAERVKEKRAFSLLQTVDLCKAFLFNNLNRPEGIPEWLVKGGEDKLYAFAGGAAYIALGGSLLLAGGHAELVARFSLLLQEGRFGNNLMFEIYARIFLAAGNMGMGMLAKGDTSLLAALDLALPDNLLMPFVGPSVFLPQLKSLKDDPTYGYGVSRILHLASMFEKNRNKIMSWHFAEGKVQLTPRERSLVRLALTGMPYRKIAEATGLAPNSIKRYFATLYKKLGISNQEQLKQYFQSEESARGVGGPLFSVPFSP